MKPFLDSIALLMRIFVEPLFSVYIFARRSIRKYKPNSLTSQNFPTNTPRGFHVETTWKRPWNPRGVFVGLYWST